MEIKLNPFNIVGVSHHTRTIGITNISHVNHSVNINVKILLFVDMFYHSQATITNCSGLSLCKHLD